MFPSASSPTSFQAGVSRESLSTRDAYLAKLNKNQMIAQNQNNKVANIQLNTPVAMQGIGQKLDTIG